MRLDYRPGIPIKVSLAGCQSYVIYVCLSMWFAFALIYVRVMLIKAAVYYEVKYLMDHRLDCFAMWMQPNIAIWKIKWWMVNWWMFAAFLYNGIETEQTLENYFFNVFYFTNKL